MKFLLPSLALLGILIGGCGGGGASGPPVTPATTMRGNGAGDAWSYSVSANLPLTGQTTGTLTQILSADTYNGQPSIRSAQTFDLTHSGQVITISTFSESSTTGALQAVISGGALMPVTSQTFHTPSTLGIGVITTGVLTLQDGSTVTTTYKVAGAERVKTDAGTFDCWLVEEQQTHSDGTTDYFILDVAPETGNWVRARAHTVYSGGQVFDWTATLFSITTAAK